MAQKKDEGLNGNEKIEQFYSTHYLDIDRINQIKAGEHSGR